MGTHGTVQIVVVRFCRSLAGLHKRTTPLSQPSLLTGGQKSQSASNLLKVGDVFLLPVISPTCFSLQQLHQMYIRQGGGHLRRMQKGVQAC